MKMSKLQAAYLAGIIDGEGYVGIMKMRKGNKSKWCYKNDYAYVPVIKIAMIDKELITWLKESYGGNFETRKARPNARESYCWTARKSKVNDILQKVYPYLRVKKKHAEIIFKYQNTNNGAGHPISEENWAKRDKLFKELRQLTKKGSVRD